MAGGITRGYLSDKLLIYNDNMARYMALKNLASFSDLAPIWAICRAVGAGRTDYMALQKAWRSR